MNNFRGSTHLCFLSQRASIVQERLHCHADTGEHVIMPQHRVYGKTWKAVYLPACFYVVPIHLPAFACFQSVTLAGVKTSDGSSLYLAALRSRTAKLQIFNELRLSILSTEPSYPFIS